MLQNDISALLFTLSALPRHILSYFSLTSSLAESSARWSTLSVVNFYCLVKLGRGWVGDVFLQLDVPNLDGAKRHASRVLRYTTNPTRLSSAFVVEAHIPIAATSCSLAPLFLSLYPLWHLSRFRLRHRPLLRPPITSPSHTTSLPRPLPQLASSIPGIKIPLDPHRFARIVYVW